MGSDRIKWTSSSDGIGTRKGAFGAKGLPILRGLSHIAMAQNYRNGFTLERTFQDSALLTCFVKWIAGILRFSKGMTNNSLRF